MKQLSNNNDIKKKIEEIKNRHAVVSAHFEGVKDFEEELATLFTEIMEEDKDNIGRILRVYAMYKNQFVADERLYESNIKDELEWIESFLRTEGWHKIYLSQERNK